MYDYNSSNARKLNYSETEYRNNSRLKTSLEKKPEVKQEKTKVKAQNASYTLRKLFLVTIGFMLAFFVVRGYVAINESDNHIKELSRDLRMVEAENQAIKAKIDKSVDLKNLQALANEKFGMVRPENYQVFYVNINTGDYAEDIKEEKSEGMAESIPVEGVTGVLISSANMFK